MSKKIIIDTPVCVMGGFGLANFGDDLLMLANLSILKRVYRDKEIGILVFPNNYCQVLSPGPTYFTRRWKEHDIQSARTTVRYDHSGPVQSAGGLHLHEMQYIPRRNHHILLGW